MIQDNGINFFSLHLLHTKINVFYIYIYIIELRIPIMKTKENREDPNLGFRIEGKQKTSKLFWDMI